MQRWLWMVAVLAALGCGTRTHEVGEQRPDAAVDLDAGPGDTGVPDAGCAHVVCGEACCAQGEVCHDGACCRPSCDGKKCGSDGCGGECGTCDDGEHCDPTGVSCVPDCEPEDDTNFCKRVKSECGATAANDNCGEPRSIDCGPCADPAMCDTATHTCRCTPEADSAFCGALGIHCGAAQGTDRCGKPHQVSECGPCANGEWCSPAGQCRTCHAEADAAFCQRLGRNCGSVSGTDNCGDARTASCGSCASPKECGTTNTCAVPGQAANDECADAELVLFDATGKASLTVDTSAATNSGDGSCNSSSGKDVVFKFVLTSHKDVTIDAAPLVAGEDVRPNVYVRSTCDNKDSELGCAKTSTEAAVALSLDMLDPGTYFLWVDAYGASSGNGRQTVTITTAEPPQAPGNDLCAGAEALAFTGDTANATGTTVGAANDATGGCAAMASGDVFYALNLGAESSVRATVQASTSGFEPSVYIVTACGSGAVEKVCAKGSGGTASLIAADLPAGDYLVVVDAVSGRGAFSLQVQTGQPISNSTCANPLPLSFSGSPRTATVDSDTTSATDDITSSCNSSSTGKDLVFSFQIPAGPAQNVHVTVTPAAGSAIKPNPSIRTICGDLASEIACEATNSANTTVELDARRLAPGTYFLWVDGWAGSTNGPFQLTVVMTDVPPPPPNDLCTAPTALSFNANVASAIGTTEGATNDLTGTCGTLDAPDAFYSFSLGAAASVIARVTRDGATPGYNPAVYIRSSCTGPAATDEKGCGTVSNGTAVAAAPNLPAGDYLVVVDGTGKTEGGFVLDVVTAAPLPNDTCAGVVPVPINATTRTGSVAADTTAARDDVVSSCNSGGTGNDLVYSFEIPAGDDQNVTVDVTPASGSAMEPSISIRRSCDFLGTEVGCARSSDPIATSLKVNKLPPGIYFLWVDGYAGSSNGPFTLSITLSDPQPPPNDTCLGAVRLAIDSTTGIGALNATTVDAINDTTGTCAAMNGGDVAFVFQLAAASQVIAKVTPDAASPGFAPAVYIRSTCDSGAAADQVACGSASAGGTASARISSLAQGTYYLIVDGMSGTEGAFSVELITSPPIDNFTCASARALTFDAATSTATVHSDTSYGSDSIVSTCNSSSTGKDLVFSFEVPARSGAQDLTVVVTPESGSALKPNPSLRRSCGVFETELACDAQSSVTASTLTARSLQPGTYYLWIDGWSGSTNGAFTMTASLAAAATQPPTNDLCTAAEGLQIDPAGIALATGSTAGASNDFDGACRGPSSADVVYSFALGSEMNVTLTATPDSGSTLKPALFVRATNCAQASDEVGCTAASSVAASTLALGRVPAGTYYVFVDGAPGTSGAFALRLDATTPPAPPSNDTCLNPEDLVFDSATRTAVVSASTSAANNDFAGTCASASATHGGGDLVYRFAITAPTTVDISVEAGASSTLRPAVYLRRQPCASTAASDELGCSSASGSSATLHAEALPVGTYYLIVDGVGRTLGAFDLEVVQSTPILNDTCASPEAIAIDSTTGIGTVHADTTRATDGIVSSCNSSSTGNDVVYSFVVPAGTTKNVEIRIEPDAASGLKPNPSVRTTCDQRASEIACLNPGNSTAPVTLALRHLAAGTYFLWIDGWSGSSNGPFTLTVTMVDPPAPPQNDVCARAEPLVFDQNGHVAASGTTIDASDDYSGGCKATTGGDVVYSFELRQDATVTATLTRGSGASWDDVLYVRSDCAVATSQLVCQSASSGVATGVMRNLGPGVYYVFVDGENHGGGAYTLELQTSAPLLHDTCAQPLPLVFSNGVATISGDNLNASGSGDGSCESGSGNDLVYSITLPSDKLVTAQLVPSSQLRPNFYLRRSCADTATEIACRTASSDGATIQFTTARLVQGTYFLWVDSYSSSDTGTFDLTVTLTDPTAGPANDACRSPEVLVFDGTGKASVSGVDTSLALDDAAGTCAATSAADVVYELTLPASGGPQKVVATVTRDATTPSFDPVVYIRQGCTAGSDAAELTCAVASSGVATATINTLAPGTYYLWVDGRSGSSGKFALDVQLSAPPAGAPTNESCATADALSVVPGTPLTVNGTTAGAQNEASGSCGSSGAADVVYSLTTTQAQKITATVNAATGFAPAIYLRKACGSRAAADQLKCSTTSTVGGSVSVLVKNAPAATYWIWVDGDSSTTSGAFVLQVALDAAVPPPAGDTCATVVPLTLNTAVSGDTSDAANDFDWGTSSACSPPSSVGQAPDLVYSYTPQASGSFTVRVDSSFDSAIWVATGTCGDASTCIEGVDDYVSYEEITVANGQAGTTYFIYIDGYSGGSGAFTVKVKP